MGRAAGIPRAGQILARRQREEFYIGRGGGGGGFRGSGMN